MNRHTNICNDSESPTCTHIYINTDILLPINKVLLIRVDCCDFKGNKNLRILFLNNCLSHFLHFSNNNHKGKESKNHFLHSFFHSGYFGQASKWKIMRTREKQNKTIKIHVLCPKQSQKYIKKSKKENARMKTEREHILRKTHTHHHSFNDI